jgi:TetR/AcrR family transcriptional regulator
LTFKQRAINDVQKEQRRQIILNKAWELFQTSAYDAININEIARNAGIAKGTVYLYFATKEQLFLEILEIKFAEWFAEVNTALEAATDPIEASVLTQLFSRALLERPFLTRLFAIAHVILEHNIDHDSARRYKTMLLEQVMYTGNLIEQRLGFLQAGEGVQLLLRAYALVIGVENIARVAPIVQEVIDSDPALSIFKADFAQEFTVLLNALIQSYRR